MSTIAQQFRRMILDQNGGEVIEWSLICGLIIVVTIVTIGAFGTKVLAKWTSLNTLVK